MGHPPAGAGRDDEIFRILSTFLPLAPFVWLYQYGLSRVHFTFKFLISTVLSVVLLKLFQLWPLGALSLSSWHVPWFCPEHFLSALLILQADYLKYSQSCF